MTIPLIFTDMLVSRSNIVKTFLLFFCFATVFLRAQIAPPPPAPPGGFAEPEVPRRMWTVGFNGGMVGYSPHRLEQVSGSNHFERTSNFGMGVVTDNEGRRRLSITANTSLGVHAGVMLGNKKGTHFTTFEGQFQANKACYSFNAPFYFTYQADTFAKWIMTDKYLCYGISMQHSFALKPAANPSNSVFLYLRSTFSQTIYHRNFDAMIYEGRFEDWTENGTGMKATTTMANQKSFMLTFEAGRRNFTMDYDRTLDFGVAVHLPFKKTYVDQYEFFQNNVSVGKSNVTYIGATVMLNLRYTFNYKMKEHERDTTIPPPDVYVNTDTTREVDVQESFTVHNKRVKILVWDRNEIDGDVVSLFMNDQIIKRNLKLRKHKRRFWIKLNPGSNILMMYAENLGTIPPNTAAVVVKDGRKKRNVNLVSDNGKSGAVEIIYVPEKK